MMVRNGNLLRGLVVLIVALVSINGQQLRPAMIQSNNHLLGEQDSWSVTTSSSPHEQNERSLSLLGWISDLFNGGGSSTQPPTPSPAPLGENETARPTSSPVATKPPYRPLLDLLNRTFGFGNTGSNNSNKTQATPLLDALQNLTSGGVLGVIFNQSRTTNTPIRDWFEATFKTNSTPILDFLVDVFNGTNTHRNNFPGFLNSLFNRNSSMSIRDTLQQFATEAVFDRLNCSGLEPNPNITIPICSPSLDGSIVGQWACRTLYNPFTGKRISSTICVDPRSSLEGNDVCGKCVNDNYPKVCPCKCDFATAGDQQGVRVDIRRLNGANDTACINAAWSIWAVSRFNLTCTTNCN